MNVLSDSLGCFGAVTSQKTPLWGLKFNETQWLEKDPCPPTEIRTGNNTQKHVIFLALP